MTYPLHVDPRFALSGLLVGFLVGQTGVGGGSLMTPLLMLVFGIHPATAVGTDLLYASATKSVGTIVHGLSHTVQWRIVRRLATGSLPGTAVGLVILSRFDLASVGQIHWVSVLLGITLIITAMSLFFRSRLVRVLGPALDRISPQRQMGLTVGTGFALGLLVTLTSVGAGALGHDGAAAAVSARAAAGDRGDRHCPCGAADAAGRGGALVARVGGLGSAG